MGAVEKRAERAPVVIPPTGLLLSIGDITLSKGGKEIPTRIDHFRPKEGALEQYSQSVAKFHQVYGAEPKQLNDVYFLSNDIAGVLEIRLMAWGKSGVRLAGDTNYAALPPDEWEKAAFAFADDVTFYPLDVKEVRPQLRDAWQGEPIRDHLNGPDDPRVKKLEVNVECTLTFLLPRVMGVGTVAKITTKSRRSMRNLHTSVRNQWEFFRGHLAGPPFRLTVRPARGRRFDADNRRYVPFDFFELVLDTPLTVAEVLQEVVRFRESLGTDGGPGSPEARALTAALAIPASTGEDVQLRDEPDAIEKPSDARLNRIAHLEQQTGVDAALVTLRGVFGVESAIDLTDDDAERYEQILSRAVEANGEAEVVEWDDLGRAVEANREAEVVEPDPNDVEWPGEAPA